MYTTSERMNLFPMTATIEQINHDSAQFMGFETINGAKIRLTIQASEIRLTASVTAADGALPPISDDSWFDMLLTDETAMPLNPNPLSCRMTKRCFSPLRGTDKCPRPSAPF